MARVDSRMISPVLIVVGMLVPAPTALAESIGLLLGVADRSDPSDPELGVENPCPQRLHTYWVKWGGGRASVSGDFAGIVVPKEEVGFTRVCVVRTCRPLPLATGKERECEDSLSVTPLDGVPPPVGSLRECGDTADPCSYKGFALTFVSPSHLAVSEREGQSETCEPRGWHSSDAKWVRKLVSREPVAFGTLGPLAAAAYARAAARAISTVSGEVPLPDDECQADPSWDVGWGIHRAPTEWKASLFQQWGLAWCQLEGDIEWGLDKRLLGYREPQVEWASVVKRYPEAEQVFSSPRGELLLLVFPGLIQLVRQGHRPNERPLLVWPREQVIMVQWATGRFVRAWSDALEPSRR